MDKPLTATGMDELCSALATLDRHGLRITGRLDAMATLDRHGLRISGHFHAMDIIQVGLCIATLESRLAEVERELDRVRVDLVTAQHAIGEGWFAGGADTATAIERKTRALEDCARDASVRAAAAEERAQEAEVSRDEWKWLYERMRDAAKEHRTRIAELEGALREARLTVHGIAEAARFDREVFDDDASFADWAQSRARHATGKIDAALTPTAPAAGAGLCSARVNSAGNLCLMPAGHAGDHYPPTERAPQVIVRTDGTGPNPTPPQEET